MIQATEKGKWQLPLLLLLPTTTITILLLLLLVLLLVDGSVDRTSFDVSLCNNYYYDRIAVVARRCRHCRRRSVVVIIAAQL